MHDISGTTGTTTTAVRVIDVSKSYPNGPASALALNHVSLALAPGSITAVMGPSGSGKSTLLNCIAGLESPDSGRIIINGVDTARLSRDGLTRFRRTHVGFVFQAYNLVDHLTVRENIRLPLLLNGTTPELDWENFLLDAVGLGGKENRLPAELSGGQAQRVAIVRALISRPGVVFADEPTGALDSQTSDEVLEVFSTTAKAVGQTVVLVTHDASVAAAAEQVLFLADGQWAGHLMSPSTADITARVMELRK